MQIDIAPHPHLYTRTNMIETIKSQPIYSDWMHWVCFDVERVRVRVCGWRSDNNDAIRRLSDYRIKSHSESEDKKLNQHEKQNQKKKINPHTQRRRIL